MNLLLKELTIQTACGAAGIRSPRNYCLYLQDLCWVIMAIPALDMYDFMSLSSCAPGLSHMTRSKAHHILQDLGGWYGTSRRLTFTCQQGPHVIWLRVVGVIEDEVLHNDAIGLNRGAPVHLHSVGVERVQPQVRGRSRGTWQTQDPV